MMRCPSCDLPLEADTVGERIVVDRCGRCGGEYIEREALHRLLAACASASSSGAAAYSRPSPFSDPVRYRKCPSCGEMMRRKNFRERSGVIVDVCAAHGVWFDRGELEKIIEFANTGAMAKADRDNAERAAAINRVDAFGRKLRAAGPRHYLDGGLTGGVGLPLDDLADIAKLIPGLEADDD